VASHLIEKIEAEFGKTVALLQDMSRDSALHELILNAVQLSVDALNPAIALTTDTSILTAIGNDYGYDYVFARQVEALGREGDVLFAISTSGNSKNILRAIQAAKAAGIGVIGFTGQGGGAMADLCDVCFRMPSGETPKVQEGHEFVGHLICGLIEHEIFAHAKG
jgi:D-sedoheptulose 7-phosphate isomerase